MKDGFSIGQIFVGISAFAVKWPLNYWKSIECERSLSQEADQNVHRDLVRQNRNAIRPVIKFDNSH
jgi:hypothetical protein